MKSILLASLAIIALSSVSGAYAYTTVDGTTNDMNTTAIRTATAETTGTTSRNTRATLSNTGITAEQLTCVRNAIAKRETSTMSALLAFADSMEGAYGARASALDSAWKLTDRKERKTAMDASWKTWRTANDTAKKTRRATHKTVWTTFKADVKACRLTSATEIDTNGAGLDSGN